MRKIQNALYSFAATFCTKIFHEIHKMRSTLYHQIRQNQTRPDQTKQDKTRPDQTRPDQKRPGQARPDQANQKKIDQKFGSLVPSLLQSRRRSLPGLLQAFGLLRLGISEGG